jgi:uncharacterized protein YeaO (DUF488 family)
MVLHTKRVYESVSADDGYRVLVDRLWPRGIAKDEAKIDLWLKDIAPSSGLREWFGHKPERFAEFARCYKAELEANPALAQLKEVITRHETVTLLYGARDEQHNQAIVLAAYLS